MSKSIHKVWTFKSESSASKVYETLQYTDQTTSCNCMGWTRKITDKGVRSCKHTRFVDQGIADDHCVSTHSYQNKHTHKETEKKVSNAPRAKIRKIIWD